MIFSKGLEPGKADWEAARIVPFRSSSMSSLVTD
jgi:hypothetical protein